MAVTIDATVGGPTANSYVTSADVDAYAEASAYAAAWAALGAGTQPAKSAFIVRAARLLDTVTYPSRRVTSTQSMQWPRYGVDSPDGFIYAMDAIPTAVKNAQMELAVWLAAASASSSDDPALDPFLGLKDVDVGGVKITPDDQRRSSPLQDALSRIALPILRAGLCIGPAGSLRLVR